MRGLSLLAFLLLPAGVGCAKHEAVVKDQLVVEQYRNRITKVRNAIDETRAVIARSQGAPYEAELNMRLAELISEEAKYHYLVAKEREGGEDGSQLHVPQVRELKVQAVDIYENILKSYPDTHLADRILFNISHEHRELGDFEKMLSALQRLVDNYPQSPYRAEALLVLGDYYFDKVELETASRYYQGIIRARDPLLLGLAQYKEAWVKVNFGDCQSALQHFEAAINAAKKVKAKEAKQQALIEREPRVDPAFEIPDADPRFAFAGHKSIDVEREALVDLTYCYAQERPPEKAVDYLESHASTREAYVAALHKMALRFATLEQPKGAADVTRELLRLGSDDDERLDDARLLHNVVTRMNDYSQVGEDVDLILRAMRRRLLRPDLDEAGQKQLVREFEMVARDLATRSQKVLAGVDLAEKADPAAEPTPPKTGKPEKNRSLASKGKEWNQIPATPQESARAYEAYLRAIPESPYRLEMVTNLADVLVDAGNFLEAGNRYREAAAILGTKVADGQAAGPKDEAKLQAPDDPPDEKKTSSDPDADQSTDKPAKASDKKEDEGEAPEISKLSKSEKAQRRADALYDAVVAYQKSLGSKQSDSHEVRATARAGLRQAGAQYLAEGNPDKTRELRIKFAIAETYYNEGKHMQAVDLLTAVALEFPGTQQGDAAVQLVLDSYNTRNDISGLIAAGQLFANAPQLSEAVKASVQPILAAAEQRRLDDLSLAAAGDQAGGMESLLAFAEVYKGSDLGEKALLNTFVAARAAGDTQKIYAVGDQILKDFPESKEVAGVAATLGQTAASRYEFDRALAYLQMAAQMSPEQAPSLYIKAGEIQEQLADKQGALKSYREALRLAPEGSRRSTAAVHTADLLENYGTPAAIIKVLEPYKADRDPEIASRLGLAYLKNGQTAEAEEELRLVVEGAAGSTPGAAARANYGLAEATLMTLEQFQPYEGLEAMEEAIGLIDVTVQAFMTAARQADFRYSQAALARLGSATVAGERALRGLQLPADLDEESRAQVNEALNARIQGMKDGTTEALAACAKRAQEAYQVDAAGSACIAGKVPTAIPLEPQPLAERTASGDLQGVDALRDTLLKNPNDLEALRGLGRALLQAHDPHAARLVLQRAVESGGDYSDMNLLGVACYEAGDRMGAMTAFGKARESGSTGAAANLAALYREMGASALAKEVAPSGTPTGALIKPAGGTQ